MLKRFASFILLGVMILSLLAGCSRGNENTETTLPTEATTEPAQTTVPSNTAPPPTTLPPETTAPSEPQAFFPMGTIGAKTSGALRSLALNMGVFCEAYPFCENILLCIPQTGQYQIRSLKDGSVLEETTVNIANTATVTDDQIIFYSLLSNKITFLDRNLDVVKTVDVSVSDDVSDMIFSQDGTKAYYPIDYYSICELNIETGEERVIPVYGPQIWALSGLHFNDSVLRYWGKEDGNDHYAFVNLETGAYLGKDTAMSVLQDWGNNYYLCRGYQGTVERLVVQDGSHRYMTPKDHGKRSCYATVLPQLNSFFTLSYDYDKTAVVMDLYDLTTKQRTSSLTVDLGGEFGSAGKVFVDTSGEYIWLCLKIGSNFNNYNMILYRWDFRANAIEDAAVYGYGG